MTSVLDLASLGDETAVVTGGAGRIGRVACQTLAELGADVAVVDLDEKGARATAEDLGRLHEVRAEAIPLDVTDDEAVADLPPRVTDAFGGLGVLVNTVGLTGEQELEGWTEAFAQQDPDTFRQALDTNLVAPFTLTQACAPDLRDSPIGAVVNVASIYGVVGPDHGIYEGTDMGNPAGYAASKGGLIQLSRWLATTLAPDVRVNAISPGGVADDQPRPFQGSYEDRTPMGRMAEPSDLKGAIAFLATDLSKYVTGQNLCVDGGWTAW